MSAHVILDFDAATQPLAALNGAAYRLIGTATCQIETIGTRLVCRLTPTGQTNAEELGARFLELVTDENVREALRVKTEPVRNLILALAFGSLAAPSRDRP